MNKMSRASLIVVDDSRTALAVMGQRLTAMNYQVVAADSGEQALDMVQARRFDLMILDLTMPGLSGLGVLAELRGHIVTRDLPVLMITARSDPAAAIAALEAGADDHVVKPFDFDLLGARIERLLDRAARMDALRRANASLDARVAQRAAELENARASLSAIETAHRELERQYQALNASVWRG
jgi:two-component system, OmpR family, response regulator